jgi:hypothetical protein
VNTPLESRSATSRCGIESSPCQGNVKIAWCACAATLGSYPDRARMKGARPSSEDGEFPHSNRQNVTSSPHPTSRPTPARQPGSECTPHDRYRLQHRRPGHQARAPTLSAAALSLVTQRRARPQSATLTLPWVHAILWLRSCRLLLILIGCFSAVIGNQLVHHMILRLFRQR